MKKTIKINLATLLLISTITLNGCKKGNTGTPGKDGNSNVTSHSYSISSWTDNSTYWYKQLSVPELTSENINTASVQVYFSTTANNWTAMPFTYIASTDHYMNFISTIGLIEVRWEYNGIGSGSSPTTIYGATSLFKVVVIPPALIKANPNINLNNYSEVKNKLNLKD